MESYLLENTENHWDLLCVEQFLRHQRQAGFGISLQLIVAVVVLHWSNLDQKSREMIGKKGWLLFPSRSFRSVLEMKAVHLEQQWKQTQLICDRSGEGATGTRNQPLQHCIRWRDEVFNDPGTNKTSPLQLCSQASPSTYPF